MSKAATSTIEYRLGERHNDRLPALAADLVRRRVAVIVGRSPGSVGGKGRDHTIPIVFGTGVDPVASGLVASLDRPGGNLTGVDQLDVELAPKRLELLHELVPTATYLRCSSTPPILTTSPQSKDMQRGGTTLGLNSIFCTPAPKATSMQPSRALASCERRARYRHRIHSLAAHREPAARCAGGSPRAADDLFRPRIRRRRRPYELRQRLADDRSPCWRLYRADSQGRKARRPAGAAGRPSSSWSSTSRPPRRSASPSRKRCWPPPTR